MNIQIPHPSNNRASQPTIEKDRALLDGLLNEAIDSLWVVPQLLDKPSAWFGHIPFAHWIIKAARPRVFVELGTHAGVSYSAFCSSVISEKIPTQCFAVDTWEGDEHAGLYGTQIYNDLKALNDQKYKHFSTMLRCTFDSALDRFQDSSIDLLHIDGFHTYEAVSHDFLSWLPKLSDRAVVLFHDTNERREGFGVWRFWAEIQKKYPSFEFLHSHGLGVLAVGQSVPFVIAELCSLKNDSQVVTVRNRFLTVGSLWEQRAKMITERLQIQKSQSKIQSETAEHLTANKKVIENLKMSTEIHIKQMEQKARELELKTKALQIKTKENELKKKEAQVMTTQIEKFKLRIIEIESENRRLQNEQNKLLSSKSWRATKPLRKINSLLPKPLKRLFRYSLKTINLATSPRNIVYHFQKKELCREINASHLFDREWYLRQYPDISEMSIDPARHYIEHGAYEGRNPSPHFSSSLYLEANPDVYRAKLNPLVHYIKYGEAEKRSLGIPKSLRYDNSEPQECSYYEPSKPIAPFISWQLLNAPTLNYKNAINERLLSDDIKKAPQLSIIMPVYDPPLEILEEAVLSVLEQSYKNFQLVLIDDKSENQLVRDQLTRYANMDSRVTIVFREKNGHISAATNSGVEKASGEFLVFLDNDDKLAPDALALFAFYIAENPTTDVIYSDDAKLNNNAGPMLISPKFKPDWSPELLLSYCYISHLKALRTSLYREIGGSRLGYEGSQDHDMLLRATEKACHVGHIPQILYHRRVLPGSTAMSGHAKPYSFEAGRKAAEDAFLRRGVNCVVEHPTWALKAGVGIYVPIMPNTGPSVAIFIPTKNNFKILDKLLVSLEKTTYENYTIYIIDNGSDEVETLRYLKGLRHPVLRIPSPNNKFNYSYINNKAVEQVDDDYVLFLNDDTEVITPNWLSQMMGWMQLDGVGAVGARLLYPDGRVQHGGVCPSLKGGLTMFRGLPREEPGYLWYAKVTRNTSAVTAAVMLTSRNLFLKIGPFDEKHFGVSYNDVDYCLKLQDAGYRVVYCGEAELYHHESYTREKNDKPSEIAELRSRYGNRTDPFYGPHFTRDDNRYGIKPVVVPPIKPTRLLRVLAITHNLNHEGAPNSAFEMISGLKKAGVIAPTVISPRTGPLASTYATAGIEVTVLECPYPDQNINDLSDYESNLAHLESQVNFEQFDVVYANTATTFWAIDAAHRAKVPSIWNIRESESWKSYYNNFPPAVAAQALECFSYPYRVVFVANSTRRRWSPIERMGNFDVIENGLDLKRLDEDVSHQDRQIARGKLNISNDAICLLCIGTVSARKGQHDLIQALKQLPDDVARKIKLYIVGARESEYTNALKELINTLPIDIQNSVILIPETDQTKDYWNAADIFILTSRLESYPRVILEAMAKGLPIISTPVYGVTEQVRKNINALFYSPGNIDELTMQIQLLVNDENFRKNLASNSREVLRGLPDYNEMLKQYGELFYGAYFSSVTSSHPEQETI